MTSSAVDLGQYELTSWGKNKDFKRPFEHTVPSGQKVLVRRLDMADILKLGIADELDFMTKALVADDTKQPSSQITDEEAGSKMIKALTAGDNFGKMEKSINVVVQAGVIAPKLHLAPPHENARQEGLTYVDDVPFNDRMSLFGEIFETEGLSSFREEPSPSVGDVPAVPDVALPAE